MPVGQKLVPKMEPWQMEPGTKTLRSISWCLTLTHTQVSFVRVLRFASPAVLHQGLALLRQAGAAAQQLRSHGFEGAQPREAVPAVVQPWGWEFGPGGARGGVAGFGGDCGSWGEFGGAGEKGFWFRRVG